MMDEAQKLTALKRAYADVILNTAKEAAARVLVTERKAMKFQQELHVAKEEAFCMLLHVKQMMDLKMREATITSSNQQVKIDELEAQLHEAEDIVRDLREELSLVQDELEKLVASRSHLEEPRLTGYTYIGTQEQEIQENRLHTSESIKCPSVGLQDEPVIAIRVKESTFNHVNEGYKYQIAKESCLENRYVSKLDFASVVLMNKEPELPRKGCTQRIRAFDSNMLEEKQSLSLEINGGITEAVVAEEEKGEPTVLGPVLHADKSCRLQNEPDELNEVLHGARPCSFSRITSTLERCQQKKKDLCSSHPNEVMEVCQAGLSSQVDDVENEVTVKRDEKKSLIEPVMDEVKLVQQADNAEVIELNRQNFLSVHQSNHAIEMFPSNVSSSGTSLEPLNNNVQCGETPPPQGQEPVMDEVKEVQQADNAEVIELNRQNSLSVHQGNHAMEMFPFNVSSSGTSLEPLNNNVQCGETPPLQDAKSGRVEVNESAMELVESCSTLQIANNDTTSIDKEEINRQRNGSEKTSSSVVNKMDVETKKAPLKSDLNSTEVTTSVVHTQPANDRLIMYTFQRKRKKEVPSITEESASLEESILKRKKAEGQNVSLDEQKSSSINESTRASRRQAQVARQLISLSEKKW